MLKVKKKGASLGVIGLHSPKYLTNNAYLGGPADHSKPISNDLHKSATDCKIFAPVSDNGRSLGSLLYFTRRLLAMPFMAFSFLAFNRTHGVSLPKTLTGAPYGNSKELLCPSVQSANLYGVAHPLGRGVGFTTNNPTLGESHE